MLGKLMKHEFLACGRIALPSYATVLLLALVGKFLTWITSREYFLNNVPPTFFKIVKTFSTIISSVYGMIFFSLLILTVFMMVYRFYKNYFTEEGYLMLTLPTGTPSLILSKLFNSWIWIFFSAVIALLSLYITIGHFEGVSEGLSNLWDALKQMLENNRDLLREELGVPLWFFPIELFLVVLAQLSDFLLSWYAAVSFGMLISKKHKLLGTLAGYFVLFLITMAAHFIYMGIITTVAPEYYAMLTDGSGKALQIVLLGSGIIYLLFSCGYFALSSYILKHKLNLD